VIVDEKTAEEVADDQVDGLDGLHLAHVGVMNVNVQAVVSHQLAREMGDRHRLDGVDAGAASGGEHGEDAGPAPEIEDDVAGSHEHAKGALVAVHAMEVREHSRVIAERRPMSGHRGNVSREYRLLGDVSMDMKPEPKKQPDLRELVREVLATAREESAKESSGQAKPETKRQPNQP
jgi:hypothetical protein